MAMGQAGIAALGLAIPGLLAFIFAVVAENKKPVDPQGLPGLSFNEATNVSTCHYPKDPTIALGVMSVLFLLISALLALVALFFPYNGVKVPISILWRSTGLVAFTVLSFTIFLVSETLLLWCIIVESDHRKHNVHSGQIDQCPSAKAGLFGGAGFLALDATLFFLIALMLTANARSDHLMEEEVDNKGPYGEVTTYPAPSGLHAAETV